MCIYRLLVEYQKKKGKKVGFIKMPCKVSLNFLDWFWCCDVTVFKLCIFLHFSVVFMPLLLLASFVCVCVCSFPLTYYALSLWTANVWCFCIRFGSVALVLLQLTPSARTKQYHGIVKYIYRWTSGMRYQVVRFYSSWRLNFVIFFCYGSS